MTCLRGRPIAASEAARLGEGLSREGLSGSSDLGLSEARLPCGYLSASYPAGPNATSCIIKSEQDAVLSTDGVSGLNCRREDRVCVLCSSGGMLADVSIGSLGNFEVCHQHMLGSAVFSSPVAFCDKVFFGCRDDHLYCFTLPGTGI